MSRSPFLHIQVKYTFHHLFALECTKSFQPQMPCEFLPEQRGRFSHSYEPVYLWSHFPSWVFFPKLICYFVWFPFLVEFLFSFNLVILVPKATKQSHNISLFRAGPRVQVPEKKCLNREESCLIPSLPDPEDPESLRQTWDFRWVSGISQKDPGLTIK